MEWAFKNTASPFQASAFLDLPSEASYGRLSDFGPAAALIELIEEQKEGFDQQTIIFQELGSAGRGL